MDEIKGRATSRQDEPPQEEILDSNGEVIQGVLPPEGSEEPAPPGVPPAGRRGTRTRAQALECGRTWIEAKVPYSQNSTYTNACGTYRQDCSGFLSMCWGLDRSYTTATMLDVADEIPRRDLQPADALLRTGHCAVFFRWEDADRKKPRVYEQYSSGKTCSERVWKEGYASQFIAIRGLSDGKGNGYPGFPLKRGSRGPAVLKIQVALSVDYRSAPGVFGPLTEAAVIAFQKTKGLEPDGIVGPLTWQAMFG